MKRKVGIFVFAVLIGAAMGFAFGPQLGVMVGFGTLLLGLVTTDPSGESRGPIA